MRRPDSVIQSLQSGRHDYLIYRTKNECMRLLIGIFIIGLVSCKQPTIAKTPDEPSTPIKIESNQNDTVAIQQVVRSFIHWYKDHYQEVNSVKFLYQDQAKTYQVNLNECTQYLKKLESSGFISQEYIQAWNKYFVDKAAYLKENPEKEGPPEGFEFDLVLITQEPELVWNAIDSITIEVKLQSQEKAVATLTGDFPYEIELSKINGNWKIDYIATMNYD